jgi:hypothetical protein
VESQGLESAVAALARSPIPESDWSGTADALASSVVRERAEHERELVARAGKVLGVDLLADSGATWEDLEARLGSETAGAILDGLREREGRFQVGLEDLEGYREACAAEAFVGLVLPALRKHRNKVLARVLGRERWSSLRHDFPEEGGGERDFVAELDESYLRTVLPTWRTYGCTRTFLQVALIGHVEYQLTRTREREIDQR